MKSTTVIDKTLVTGVAVVEELEEVGVKEEEVEVEEEQEQRQQQLQ
jgi:hypothetical protein